MNKAPDIRTIIIIIFSRALSILKLVSKVRSRIFNDQVHLISLLADTFIQVALVFILHWLKFQDHLFVGW